VQDPYNTYLQSINNTAKVQDSYYSYDYYAPEDVQYLSEDQCEYYYYDYSQPNENAKAYTYQNKDAYQYDQNAYNQNTAYADDQASTHTYYPGYEGQATTGQDYYGSYYESPVNHMQKKFYDGYHGVESKGMNAGEKLVPTAGKAYANEEIRQNEKIALYPKECYNLFY